MSINTSALNLNSDMTAQAPAVSTNTENLGPNKWIVASVAVAAALAVNVTNQVKEDRFDLASNIGTASAALLAGGVSYKVAKDAQGVPTSLCSVLAGSIGILSAMVVEPIGYVVSNKVVGSMFTHEGGTEEPVAVTEELEIQVS